MQKPSRTICSINYKSNVRVKLNSNNPNVALITDKVKMFQMKYTQYTLKNTKKNPRNKADIETQQQKQTHQKSKPRNGENT